MGLIPKQSYVQFWGTVCINTGRGYLHGALWWEFALKDCKGWNHKFLTIKTVTWNYCQNNSTDKCSLFTLQ